MTQQRTHRTLLGIAAAAVLIATACAPSGGPSASSTTTTQETPVAGGRVIRGSFSDIRDLNPVISAEDYLARAKAVARSKLTTQKSSWNDVEGFNDYRDGKATSISGITIDSANPKKFTVKFGKSFCPALINVFGIAPIPAHVFGKY